MISPPIKASVRRGVRKPKRMKNSTVNKRLAVLDGWEETKNKNWKSPNGIVYVLPPDYCSGPYQLPKLLGDLSLKKKARVARAVLAELNK